MKKKHFMRIFALLLAMVMLAGIPMEAYAASKTIAGKTLKKAPSVKTGKKTVEVKKVSSQIGYSGSAIGHSGYIKFTAPKTKTYKFTISNLRTSKAKTNKVSVSGSVMFYNKKKNTYTFKQNGEKGISTLWLESKYAYSLNTFGEKDTASADLPVTSRSASIKLKKGTTIYIDLYGARSKKDKGNVLFDVTIK